MKYFVNYGYSSPLIHSVLKNIPQMTDANQLLEADFVYESLFSNQVKNNPSRLSHKYYKNAKFVNNFLDKNNNICITGDYCLNNKYSFVDLHSSLIGKKKYVPKTYPFHKNSPPLIHHIDFSDNVFILKPENDFARGGITIIRRYQDLMDWLQKYPRYEHWVLQRYVHNPLLCYGRKFHFRSYMLMIMRPHSNKLELYLFKNYFMFGAAKKFNLADDDEKCHLTGAKYCNVHLVNPKVLAENNIQFERIEPQIIEIAKDCGYIAQKTLRHLFDYQTNFHLFACDIICDENYQCHLLEVNNGVVGSENGPRFLAKLCPNGGQLHDTEVITKLFKDMFYLVLDKNAHVNGYQKLTVFDTENKTIEGFSQPKSILLDMNRTKLHHCYVLLILIVSMMLIAYLLYLS